MKLENKSYACNIIVYRYFYYVNDWFSSFFSENRETDGTSIVSSEQTINLVYFLKSTTLKHSCNFSIIALVK